MQRIIRRSWCFGETWSTWSCGNDGDSYWPFYCQCTAMVKPGARIRAKIRTIVRRPEIILMMFWCGFGACLKRTILLQLLKQKKDNRCNINAENTRCLETRRRLVREDFQTQRERQSYIVLARGRMGTPGCWVGDIKDIEKSGASDDGQRRGANKRRSHGKCQRNGPIRDGYASWRNSRSSFSREALRGSKAYLPLDQRSKTTSHQKWQGNWLQYIKLWTHW